MLILALLILILYVNDLEFNEQIFFLKTFTLPLAHSKMNTESNFPQIIFVDFNRNEVIITERCSL